MKKKNVAISAILIVALFFLFSVFFLEQNSKHECIGASCEICEQIQICKKNIEDLGFAGVSAIIALAVVFARPKNSIFKKNFSLKDNSLIDLKTELLA